MSLALLHIVKPMVSARHGAGGVVASRRVRARRAATLVLGSVAASLVWAGSADAASWSSQSSGTTRDLNGVSCPDASTCYTVGESGTIRATTDGGASWSGQSAGAEPTGHLYSVSCPTAPTCYAVGGVRTIIVTTDGGASWSSQSSGTSPRPKGIACPTASTCYAVGNFGTSTIIATTDGGSSWSSQSSGTSNTLNAISCPTASTCYTVGKAGTIGESGTIRATTDGGSTWGGQSSGTLSHLSGISCPTASTCYAVGGGLGTIIATTDGGSSWSSQFSGTSDHLNAISCPTASTCYAVGTQGTIIVRTVASESCDSPAPPLADGFAGDTYVKVRVANPSAEQTWICVQMANTAGNVGGRFAVDSSKAPEEPSVDDSHEQCSAEKDDNLIPGPHSIDNEIGDPDDPPHVVTELDSFTDGERAWVCVFAAETSTSTEFGKRVVIPFPGEDAVEAVRFEPDDPAAPAPVPDPAPIDPSFASATCQNGSGGTYQRALNSDLGGEHVWLDAWQESDTRAHLCVRLQGTANLGGRLSVDALGTGLTPVLETSETDMSPCTTQVHKSEALDTEVRRSATGTVPASLCVRQGTTQQRVTAGVEGSPALGVVAWTPDPGTPGGPLP